MQRALGEPERGGVEGICVIAPFAEARPGAAQIEHGVVAHGGRVAERCAGVAAVVVTGRDQESVDLSFAGGVRRAESPVVAIFSPLVPIAAQEQTVGVVDAVVDLGDKAVVIVRAELIGEIVGNDAGTVREGIEGGVILGYGVDAGGIDDVAGKRLARVRAAAGGEGIVDDAGERTG